MSEYARPAPSLREPSVTPPVRVILLMGVSGAGKTTLGQALAAELGWAFEDADAYHADAARAKMGRGEGLTDADRAPWLDRLAALVEVRRTEGPSTVLACSALRAAYRVRLGTEADEVAVVWLDVPRAVLADRLATRAGHYAGPDLLDSQLDTLEPPDGVLHLDGTTGVDTLIKTIRDGLGV